MSIFRRGVPFIDFRADGSVEAGLHFVSFQGSIDQFTTMFDEWIGNAEFPAAGTGKDQLFEQGFAKVTHAGFFFVPAPSEFLCSDFLKPKVEDDRCTGHVAIRKLLFDGAGNPIRAERGGFEFQLIDTSTGLPVGEVFTTDSSGRALSGPVPLGQTYTLHEVVVRSGFTTAVDQTITLDRRRMLVEVRNVAVAANPGYGQ